MGPFLFYSGIYSIMAKKLVITESQLKRMVQNEQLLKNLGQKIKSGVSTGMDQLKTGINKVATKVANSTAPAQADQPASPEPAQGQNQAKGRNYEEVKAEWSKVNSDMSNTNGFGEGVSKDLNIAKSQGELNARAAILHKMGKSQASFSSSILDDALWQLPNNGGYNYLVIMQILK